MSLRGGIRRRGRLFALSAVLAVVAVFSFASPSGAVPGLRFVFVEQPSDTLAGQPITPAVSVALVDAEDNVVTQFQGPVTLTLQGGGTLWGTTTRNAVNGVATFPGIAVTPAGTYTLLATSQGKDPGTSDPFEITGIAVNCLRNFCEASTGDIKNTTSGDPTAGYVRVPVSPCPESFCFLTVIEDQGCPPDVDCRGNAFLFIPPSNANGTIIAKLACDVLICPRGEFVQTFKQRTDGTWVELFDCPVANPTPSELGPNGCIQNRSRTPSGDLITTAWLPPTDPRIVN